MVRLTYKILLLIFVFTACNQKPAINAQQLVEEYMHHPYMEDMSTGVEEKNLMAELFRGIKNKSYQEVIDQINRMEYKKNMRLNNMKAICHLGLKEYDVAEEMFLKMKNDLRAPKLLRNDASWHLLLLYLDSGQHEKYNAEMQYHLQYPTHFLYNEAVELYEKTGDL